MFIARLTKSQSTPPLFGLSSFLYLSFRDCGCGKAMSFDDLFRKDRHDPLIFLASGAIQTYNKWTQAYGYFEALFVLENGATWRNLVRPVDVEPSRRCVPKNQ